VKRGPLRPKGQLGGAAIRTGKGKDVSDRLHIKGVLVDQKKPKKLGGQGD